MTSVRLDHIHKQFDKTMALDDIDLQVNAGELFFLLGPSGCGKSTLLRLIAGLHEPTSGQILFNDRDVTALGTDKRNAVMCFQSYALWPHMTVRENVAFGLGVRKIPPTRVDPASRRNPRAGADGIARRPQAQPAVRRAAAAGGAGAGAGGGTGLPAAR